MASLSEMKQCPVCATAVFGDMDTCYNCMYRFGSNEELEASRAAAARDDAGPAALPGASRSELRGDGALLAQFLVEFDGFLRQFLAHRVVGVE